MTAYDIIARLKMAPDQYRQAVADGPRHNSTLSFDVVRVEPLRFGCKDEHFCTPAEESYRLAAELNTIFATARTLTT